jgi:5-oxoprolinase (ATP-hydrolysing)
MADDRWQFWIDVGGTFTDCLARRPDGTILRRKVLSSAVTKGRFGGQSAADTLLDSTRDEPPGFWRGYALRLFDGAGKATSESVIADSQPGELRFKAPHIGPGARQQVSVAQHASATLTAGQGFGAHNYELASPEEAPSLAIRLFLGLRLDQPILPCIIRLGTTRGTNALLTRRGAKTAFITTRGHGDVLRIGYQNRPQLFELAIKKPQPLFSEVAEIDERIAADGRVLSALDEEQARAEISRLKAAGIESLAICLLNAYANPAHERKIGQIARELGFTEISVSTEVSPLMKIVPRGDTTVVDAYLNPILRNYVQRLAESLPGSDVRLMTSAGGLVSAANFTGKDSILSGPAGGVVGFSRVAEAAGFQKAIGFDMGGTSTDVSRFDGRFEYEYETQKAGVRIVAPMLAIETVAAGGGSICRFDGVKLVVGPESAGADPGPACYGRGGPLTITDCNLYLGRILPEHFPFPLDFAAVERRLSEVFAQIPGQGSGRHAKSTPSQTSSAPVAGAVSAIAEGFVRIANANMAQAIRSISLAKGYDPREYLLVPFGSAGPQHACAVAEELGMRSILLHPDSGVLSALGIGLADVVKHRAAPVYRLLDPAALDSARIVLNHLAQDATADVWGEGATDHVQLVRALDLRYQGTEAALTIIEPPQGDYQSAFDAEHRRRYGYEQAGRPIEIVAARVEAVGKSLTTLPRSEIFAHKSGRPPPSGSRRVLLQSRVHSVPMYRRSDLQFGDQLVGPCIVAEEFTTNLIERGWQVQVMEKRELWLVHIRDPLEESPSIELDPTLLELLRNHFTAIATQMGITLRNTATSVNVKERLDFSCAIFTADGDLVVNAPHIPVHLGAMGETVKSIIADNPNMQAGDVFLTNDPYRGGSHLPDLTLVTPVFSHTGQRLFFTASRAHHAEIGGITPGSVPPFSKNLAEEGVLIRNFKVLDAGGARMDELRKLLTSGPHPSRSPETNLADFTAQLAANQQGVMDLLRLVDRYSQPVVLAYMRHIQDAAERKMRIALSLLPPGRREFVDYMDDGTPIRAAVTITGDSATIDFTGTGPVSRGNLNANRAIVTAAVMYVLRLLIGEEIPLNHGVLAPVEIMLPECILNPPEGERPEDCPAVVGGNVETSQRVVDVLLGAFGLAAASQGTMNNLLFGNATFGYYETICGGSGATAAAAGADAVHTHMTNTRLTDAEVLEARCPARLLEFSIRRGSGGAGRQRGGDGTRRRIEFLRPLVLSILSQRRGRYPPYGMDGGSPGALGRNTLARADGSVIELGGSVQMQVQPGDVLTIETPGGGGWGTNGG